MQGKIYIFDIDGTIIDSDHRYKAACNLDGTLNLPKYLKTRHLMHKDTLLPLANYLRRKYEQGHYIVLATSRNIDEMDLQFLRDNNIPYHTIKSRPWGMNGPDGELKRKLLMYLNNLKQFRNREKIFFDDLNENLKALSDFQLLTPVLIP